MIRTIKRSDGDGEEELDIYVDEEQDQSRALQDDWEVMSVQAKPLNKFVGFDA
jgi:hypothetical protein